MISTWCGRIYRKNAGCISNIVIITIDVVNFFSSFFLSFESVRNAQPDSDHPDAIVSFVMLCFVVFFTFSYVRSFFLSIFINFCRLHRLCDSLVDQTECVLNCILLNETQHVVDPWCGNLLVWLFFPFEWSFGHVNEQLNRALHLRFLLCHMSQWVVHVDCNVIRNSV